jgi:hypothetical protein
MLGYAKFALYNGFVFLGLFFISSSIVLIDNVYAGAIVLILTGFIKDASSVDISIGCDISKYLVINYVND